MRRFLLSVCLIPALWAQTAKFPSAVATDSDLTVAKNRKQTTLLAPVAPSDNAIYVTSGTGLVANMLLTIDDKADLTGTFEIVKVCSVVGNVVQIGNSSCPNVDGRGFDGTSAISHAAGAKVSGFTDAYPFNAAAAEIKAVETALGANLANVVKPADNPTWTGNHIFTGGSFDSTAAFSTAPNRIGVADPGTCDASKRETFFNTTSNKLKVCTSTNVWTIVSGSSAVALASDYGFTQTPGADLGIGANFVTLSPCPLGVNGTDTGHYVYISGGVGVAEAALITGGTCTSGAASGTVIFSVAGTHTGAWTIQSATGGIQEAVCALPAAGGEVTANQSTTLYASVSACAKTKPAVHKPAGVTLTGSFKVLDVVASGTNIDDYIGSKIFAFNIQDGGDYNGYVVQPTMDGTVSGVGWAFGVIQQDKTKLSANQYLHGISAVLENTIPAPNQVGGLLSWVKSYGGADPFGADVHAVVPSTATAVPTHVIGIQAGIEIDTVGLPGGIVAGVYANNEASPQRAPYGVAFEAAGSPWGQILSTTGNAFGGEGIVLIPADDLHPGYRAFALTNAANTRNNWQVNKAGTMTSYGGVSAMVSQDGATQAGWRIVRTNDVTTNFEDMYIGADVHTPNAFEIYAGKGGTGTLRPLVFWAGGAEAFRINADSTTTFATAVTFSSTITEPSIKATTGTRYVCVNTSGTLVSSASACSGT